MAVPDVKDIMISIFLEGDFATLLVLVAEGRGGARPALRMSLNHTFDTSYNLHTGKNRFPQQILISYKS